MKGFYESELEEALLGWLRELGYGYQFGPNLAPGEPKSERESFAESFLPERLRSALHRLNPALPPEALEDAFRKVARVSSPSLVQANRLFHRMLVEGADVEYLADGRIIYDKARLVDFEHPDENDWLAVNQFAMIEGQWNRRPDVVIFLNGLPVAVFELKNPADENATVWTAYNQLQTYKQQIPSLFSFNEALVVSDGLEARMGSLTAGKEWFLPWKTIEGREPASENLLQLEVLVRGMFERERFLQLLRHFIVFEESDGGVLQKKIAGYHQFHAVNRAVETAQIIEELIGLAREIREAGQRGEKLGLSEDEVAFYDALEVNDSAVKVLGDETLKTIARELVTAVRNNVAIDWTVRESVRAKMRAIVKRILRKYGYPPDKQEKATQTVLEQAELLCGEWA